MSRPIDADALKAKCGTWYAEEGTEEGFIGTLGSLLDAAPTIDAIPVEWMINRANAPERAPLYRRYAQMLYEEWQNEQEAQDGGNNRD